MWPTRGESSSRNEGVPANSRRSLGVRGAMSRVVVIGGGIAGYCAALGARREGAEVTVIARAPGATALYAGAMEVVDDIETILKKQPHNPLKRHDIDGVRMS